MLRVARVLHGGNGVRSSSWGVAWVTGVRGFGGSAAWRSSSSEEGDSSAVAEKRDFQPSYRHVVEMFLDEFATGNEPHHRGLGWKCQKAENEEDQELFHWRDRQQFTDKSVVRVEMAPLGPKLRRFVEVHFHHRLLLVHQHDFSQLEDVPEEKRERLTHLRETLNEKYLPEDAVMEQVEQMVHFNDVGIDRSLTTYAGFDIPSNWLMVLKSQRWPASYVPEWLEKVQYFEFFRDAPMMDTMRERHAHGEDPNRPYWWDTYQSLFTPGIPMLHPTAPALPAAPGVVDWKQVLDKE